MHHIEIKNVSKEIKGNLVLKNINLSLQSGQIYGIIGNNGSGKTMLLRALGGLIKPTYGEILFNDKHLCEIVKEKFKIGMIIENASLYPDFTGLRNLIYLAKINNYIS